MNNRHFGNVGEETACQFLEEKGIRILERNKHFGRIGEIDIIAEDSNTLLFVEVKTLRSKQFGHPIERISKTKQRRICQMAEIYLSESPSNKDVRFDVISIKQGEAPEYFVDAFRAY